MVKENDKQRYKLIFEPNVPPSSDDAATQLAQTEAEGTWLIRANQGHSLQVDGTCIGRNC